MKDRAALAIVRDAEAKGLLKPGGTVVEGTAGNTGIGLAHICLARGYKCVIFIPDNQSKEKLDTLRALGCDVRAVPAAPFTDPRNYNQQARAFAEATPGAFWGNQFDNVANREGHFRTTGPEIWRQTEGKVNGFVCATGTGGTLGGVGRYLKQRSRGVSVWCADPPGSVLFDYVSTGRVPAQRKGASITEGIGQGRVTANFAETPVDGAIRIDDDKTVFMLFRMLRDEGLALGTSAALNLAAAVEMAQLMPAGSSVVTVLCDGAARYQSRIFSRAWLAEKGLLQAVPADCAHFLRD